MQVFVLSGNHPAETGVELLTDEDETIKTLSDQFKKGVATLSVLQEKGFSNLLKAQSAFDLHRGDIVRITSPAEIKKILLEPPEYSFFIWIESVTIADSDEPQLVGYDVYMKFNE